MLTDAEITSAATRLESDKLTGKDVDSLVSSFRILLGPLEEKYNYDLVTDLEALDDSANDRAKAAKMAAILIRLQNEDFSISSLTGELENSDNAQRNLFIIYALSLLYVIPAELAFYLDLIGRANLNKIFSSSVQVTYVP